MITEKKKGKTQLDSSGGSIEQNINKSTFVSLYDANLGGCTS